MTKKGMNFLLFSLVLVAIALIIRAWVYSSIGGRQDNINFQFEIKKEFFTLNSTLGDLWEAAILLSPQDYTKENLNRLFSWYSQKHVSKPRIMVKIYTDRDKIRTDEMVLLADPPPLNRSSSQPPDNGFFLKEPNLSSQILEKDEWYIYYPDLNNPHHTKSVVLNGKDRYSEKISESNWVSSYGDLHIGVKSYELKDVEPLGIYHTFLCKLSELDEWKELFTARQVERHNDPTHFIRRISDEFIYVFMGGAYAATLDGGKTWFGWNAKEQLINWQCCDPYQIQDITIASNGYGSMVLNENNPQGAKTSVLRTSDYGKNWSSN